MKLKCNDHNRRVVTGKKSFLHKTGDCSPCDSRLATIGTRSFENAGSVVVASDYSFLDLLCGRICVLCDRECDGGCSDFQANCEGY